ncbi:unnamed protein product [Rhizophagus irregularis]|nr:unnamed protein product [Rhizophagus irregularis]
MSNRGAAGGKPLHCFCDFVQVNKNIKINQSNCLAICKGCIAVKGLTWAETEAQKLKMSNTVPSIGKHLSECENFKITYPDEINYVKENIEARKQRTNDLRTTNNLKKQLGTNQFQNLRETSQDYLDETEDDRASFTTHSTRTNDSHSAYKRLRQDSFGQGVKIQTTMNQFIGRKILPNEIPIFHRLLLRMTISNGWTFQWVENQETIEFFNFISPSLQLPSRKTLADTILKESAKNV